MSAKIGDRSIFKIQNALVDVKKVLLPQFWQNSEIELLKVTCFTKEVFADITAASILHGNSLHESFQNSDFSPQKEKMTFLMLKHKEIEIFGDLFKNQIRFW